jgi:hypothetical protein
MGIHIFVYKFVRILTYIHLYVYMYIGKVICVITEDNQVIVLDLTNCPFLKYIYIYICILTCLYVNIHIFMYTFVRIFM